MFRKTLIAVALFVGFFQFSLILYSPASAFAITAQEAICEKLPAGQKVSCNNTASADTEDGTLAKYMKRVVNPLLVIGGIAAVIMLIVGGIRFVVSAGSQDAVQGAKKTISYALIGLVIVILAYAIVSFVVGKLA